MANTVDADFLALPLSALSDAAIDAAKAAGASHVDVRIERTRTGYLSLRDAKPETQSDESNLGIGVRVIVDGAWGFASSPDLSNDTAKKLALSAVAMAKTSKPLSTDEIKLVSEPVYPNKTWVSSYKIDPFLISDSEKKDRLASLSSKLLHPLALITPALTLCLLKSRSITQTLPAPAQPSRECGCRPRLKQSQLAAMVLKRCELLHNLPDMAGSGWITQSGIGIVR